MARILGLLLLYLSYSYLVSGQGCLRALQRNLGSADPPFADTDNDSLPADNAVQAIITTYKFSCDCVNITSWETYVKPGGGGYQVGNYDITFQVWRPSPTVNDTGCYSLVGQNVFASVSFLNSVHLTPTPPLNTIITAQSGDVVGYYTNSRLGQNEGIQLNEDNAYDQNIIWYLDFDPNIFLIPPNIDCPFPVGTETDRTLRHSTDRAPILKVNTIPCDFPFATRSTILSSVETSATTSYSSTVVLPGSTPATTSYSSTDVLPGSSDETVTLIVAVVAMVVALILFTVLIIPLIVFFLKRKKSTSKVKLDVNSQQLPNSCSVIYQNEGSSSKKETVGFDNEEKNLNINFQAIKQQDQEYAEISSMHDKKPKHTYQTLGEDDLPDTCHKETTFYHELEPTGYIPTLLNVSVPPPVSAQTNMKTKNSPSNERVYHVLEEPMSNRSTHYEELAKFVSPESSQNIIFDTTGCYVPTLEQRSKSGPIYEECLKSMNHYKRLQFFVEDDIYWAPATTTSGLYSQLASKKYREIQRSQIRLEDCLGSGQFGEVYKATWSINKHKLELAVKTLKGRASEEDKVKFLQEAAIMGQFRHTNVIKMYGVVTLGEPVYICLEILENGDLGEFLQSLNLNGAKFDDFTEEQRMFLKFARDIAAGMEYLLKKKFVHRDLAARNILLNKYQTCKIADFGMARNLMDDTYYTSSGGKIPIKWTAPEALLYKKYSTDSDVWSYGMVLFEIWSVGKKPFSGYTNSHIIRLKKGFCQAPPPGCPRAIYELMVDCWNPDHQLRPNFHIISQKYLKQPSSKLLYWESEDDHLSPAVGICGASLEEANYLHQDLQNIYTN